jgi:tRNA-2-methylthio-N6-dimethylallyladenosine synthase
METYGCQMNKAESEAILLSLHEAGWTQSGSDEDADLVILNTCSVRETAEQRIRGRLGHFRRAKRSHDFTLVLTGCMAERLKEKLLEEHPEVDVVVGTFNKSEILSAVRASEAAKAGIVAADGAAYEFPALHSAGSGRAYVPIMHGCNNWCTYCIVPRVRGPEVSRAPLDVLAELRRLEERGVREVTLLGQNVNSYMWHGQSDLNFPGLLRMLEAEVRSLRWVRFLTSHPKDLSGELIDTIAASRILCRHVHLPLQSGSTRILGLMNRRYTSAAYVELVRGIRSSLRGVAITTDILIGFPGETESDFQETLAVMREVGFDDAFMYHYNPREGTAACALPAQVAEEVQQERLERVIEVQRSIKRRKSEERIGSEVEILVEDVSKKDPLEVLGRTEWDAMAVVPGGPESIGTFVKVRLESLRGSTFRARRI